jgi:hypothetical protein
MLLASAAVSYPAGGGEGWMESDLIQPQELAAELLNPDGAMPIVLDVGFDIL